MKILAVTGTRADWGLLVPVLSLLRDDPRFALEVAVTGQHLMAGSSSLAEIAADGHAIDHRIDMGLGSDDSAAVLAGGMGIVTAEIGRILASSQPDMVLVLGDRYEIVAVALAAVVARIPVAHMFGGDVTEGAMDDAIRHALTKLASMHFPSNGESAKRIVQMGENPAAVHNVGSTGIDRIVAIEPMARDEFFASVGLTPQPQNFIITFHPATLSSDSTAQAQAMLDGLAKFPGVGLVFTGSNADPGAREIDAIVQAFARHRANAIFHESLGSRRYFSGLAHCDLVLGNSSSGILEAPSFGVPTVNIGDRQARRPRAASIIDCDANANAIAAAIEKALALDCTSVTNPYGDGRAAGKIVTVLAAVTSPKNLVRKSFVDLAS